ncbi:arginine repressor [Enterococcus sp. LJL98]
MKKSERHAIIEKLIHTHVIRTQEELLGLLKAQGVTATQATISRDIRELKIVKSTDTSGRTAFQQFHEEPSEEPGETQHLNQLTQDVVTKVDRVQFMTILHTIPNNAPILAAAIDEITMKEKVCTLAGFDTVAVISPDEASAIFLEDFFRKNIR